MTLCDSPRNSWPAVLFKEKVNDKQPGGAGFAPHQDATAYRFVGHHISVMVPLDPGTIESGCLYFAPGHEKGQLTRSLRLHVAAKRYLCAVDPTYGSTLSPSSVRSLAIQGGPMSADEIEAFKAEAHFEEAVQVRRWDDLAKVAGAEVPPIEEYRPLLESLV